MTMQAIVHRLTMQHPGDLGALAALLDAGALEPANVAAVIGKTDGIAAAVQAAMRDAGIDDTNDVGFVQVKTPCVTTARAAAAAARGASVVSTDANRAMAYARAAGAFGVAAALGEVERGALTDQAM